MEIAVLVVAFLAVLTTWVTWTTTRLDRLDTRVDAAQASLDAQLVRRAAAVQALADQAPDRLGPGRTERLRTACRAALEADVSVREAAENDLGRALADLPPDLDPASMQDLADASTRVVLARRFYNDAVRDTRALRSRRLPRMLAPAGRRPLPAFFEIADTSIPPRRVIDPAQAATEPEAPASPLRR